MPAQPITGNWTSCDNNYFSLETLLMALHAEAVAPIMMRGLKICAYQGDGEVEEIITCDTQDSWLDLFRQALTYGDDGGVSLRVYMWTGLYTDVPICANGESLDDVMRTSFVMTDEGVAFVIFSACTDR